MVYYPEWNTPHVLFLVSLIAIPLILMHRELYPQTQLQYSKFSSNTQKRNKKCIPSFYGMVLIYTPSFLICSLLLLYSIQKNEFVLISFVLFAHYLKRVVEVCFVHQYSGSSQVVDSLIISISYSSYSLLVYYCSIQVKPIVSNYYGLFVFIVGEGINGYHHILLTRLRKNKSKEYKIPYDGLFRYCWCPHYGGEIISFISIVLISQHIFVLVLQLGSCGYLMVRAYNTREWYKSKFETIPKRACIIPFIL